MAPSPSSRIENSKFCVFVILVTQVSIGFLMGFNLSALNSAAPAIKVFINESYTDRYNEPPSDELATLILTLAQSILVWGSLVGALMVKPVLQHFSRKEAIFIVHLVSILSGILMGPAAKFGKSFESLIIGRFFAGVSRGIGFSSILIIVAEMSCHRRVGLYQSPLSLIIFTAATIGAGLGHKGALGTPNLWIWITCIPALSSLAFFLCWPWLPETPVSLLRRGKREEALRLLKKLRADPNVDEEIEIMQKEISQESNRQEMSLMTILKTPQFRMQFFIVVLVMNSPQLIGLQAITLYSDFILLEAGVGSDYVTFVTMGMFMEAFVAFLLYVPLQRKYGTKRVFVLGLCICSASLFLFTVASALHQSTPWMSYMALATMCTLLFGVQLGPQFTMLSLPAELTTDNSRPTVAFYSGCMFWIIGSITGFVFPYSVAAWNAYAFIPYVAMSSALIPFIVFLVPETNRRSSARIQASFRKKSTQSMSEIFTASGNASISKNAKPHHNYGFEVEDAGDRL